MRMWTLRGTWSSQAAFSPPPLRPKQEREAPEKSNIRNIPTLMLHEVRMGRIFHLHLSTPQKDAAAAMAPALERITTP